MIQERREAMSMTQRELAKKAQVTPGYIAQLEMGLRKNPSRASLRKLAKALEVSMDELMMEPQEQREKLRRLKTAEVLREAALGSRTRAWFEGALSDYPDPYIADATKALAEAGLVARTRDGRGYRATESGRKYLEEHRLGEPDWIVRAELIDFP
jgi:transcriptional regulator with XRE-family HTH domain